MKNSNWQTMKIDYKAIWDSINAASGKNAATPQMARRIPGNGVFDVFLATDVHKNIRLLYVRIENENDITIDNLPNLKGLKITTTVTSIASIRNALFLTFTQSILSAGNIFELVISDLCDRIISLKHKRDLSPAVINTLYEWELFFEKQESELLSPEVQKGLVGELFFLKDYLFRKYPFAESIRYWTAPDVTNHDFQILNKAVELKTTSGKQHKKFNVSSEKQLDNTGLEHLYLSLFSLNLHQNMPGKTLPELIHDIYLQISEDPLATYHFQLKLTKYGYLEADAEKYTTGFSLSEMRFFEITEGFPRLLGRHLPDGVGDLEYSVAVAACTPYEIKTDILTYI